MTSRCPSRDRAALGRLRVALVLLLAISCTSEDPPLAPDLDPHEQLLVCGWDAVMILDLAVANGTHEQVWSWKASDRLDLPPPMRDRFATTTDCKPVGAGEDILITASSGGVALVQRATGSVLFHAVAVNAHSAELLPNERIVVAASVDVNGNGDRLIVYDIDKPGTPLFDTPLQSAHGVVWDASRQVLWAVGYDELRQYSLGSWESSTPTLDLVDAHTLPDADGHDLSVVPGTTLLVVSTHASCWLFDREQLTFAPFEALANLERVKSIAIHPETGQTAYVQAEGTDWWAETIHFRQPDYDVYLPGSHFYKVRWDTSS
jgi:hypothetical protein